MESDDVYARAERWHDTDHKPDGTSGWSSCWCCCAACDPDHNPQRPNPFWAQGQQQLRVDALEAVSRLDG